MNTNGLYIKQDREHYRKVIAICFLCGQELPVENSTPHVHWIITDKGDEPIVAFLCGTCDKRQRQ